MVAVRKLYIVGLLRDEVRSHVDVHKRLVNCGAEKLVGKLRDALQFFGGVKATGSCKAPTQAHIPTIDAYSTSYPALP
jgi:hypothetical protein